MSARKINLQQISLFLVAMLFASLIGALLMSSAALQSSARFGYLYSPLLVLLAIGLVILVTLLAINLRQLVFQVRHRRAGSRLTVRILALSVLLAVIPVLLVFFFSLEFLNRRLDSWFDVNIEQAMQDALELSRSSLDMQMRDALQQTEHMRDNLIADKSEMMALQLGALRAHSSAVEVSLLSPNGHIIAFNSSETEQLLPTALPHGTLLKLKQQDTYINLENLAQSGLYIRVLMKCHTPASGAVTAVNSNFPCLLHALYPVDARLNTLAKQVESGLAEYQQLVFLRQPLKLSFTLVLSLVLLLSIFGAVWVAFFSVRRLVAPVRDLVEGTRAVAAGDYSKVLPVTSQDELGFLVRSFNDMTWRIQLAQNEARQSQELADTQRAYLEVVLERLSSGVLTLDENLLLHTTNSAAEQILQVQVNALRGKALWDLCEINPELQPLCDTIQNHLNCDQEAWQEQLILFGSCGRKILMCRGKRLDASVDNAESGHVIVFDDITALIQAQRHSAWGEVARRLAHEIKNPLTPIQLSAERLRHKYLPSFPDKEAEVLDRMTHTIIQQVESLKEMVNSFNAYARPPQLKLQPLSLNTLVQEVLDLYGHQDQRIELNLATALPVLDADAGQLRQVIHNLVKNALETGEDVNVTVSTQYCQSPTVNYVELKVEDTGPGIDAELLDQVFEPYVTSKPKGSGLGLAIVKKIVEEHGGMVTLENRPGACINIRLPVAWQANQRTSQTTTQDNTQQIKQA
jgi:nitrogen fixation/metabolism regulation signal transduction histidine kinase